MWVSVSACGWYLDCGRSLVSLPFHNHSISRAYLVKFTWKEIRNLDIYMLLVRWYGARVNLHKKSIRFPLCVRAYMLSANQLCIYMCVFKIVIYTYTLFKCTNQNRNVPGIFAWKITLNSNFFQIDVLIQLDFYRRKIGSGLYITLEWINLLTL